MNDNTKSLCLNALMFYIAYLGLRGLKKVDATLVVKLLRTIGRLLLYFIAVLTTRCR